MGKPFRVGSTHRPFRVKVFTEDAPVDFPAEFPGGVTFRAVSGATVIAGAATGDALGNLSYQWQAGDLAVAGVYQATFTGIDALGRPETFPPRLALEIEVIIVP